jgi:nitroreductase
MPEGTDVFEIIHSTRAMRRLKPDPVPDELIRTILLAGQAAASGGNTQLALSGVEGPGNQKESTDLLQEGFRRGSRAALRCQPRRLGSRLRVTSAHALPTNI